MTSRREPRPTRSAPSAGPVFVDASNRRLRGVRIAGSAAIALVLVYLALIATALLGGPDVMGPLIPAGVLRPAAGGAAAPTPSGTPTTEPSTAPVAGEAVPSRPVTVEARTPQPAATTTTTVSEPVASSEPTATPTATPAPAPAPEPTATSPRTVPAAAEEHARNDTAPGQAHRPSEPPRS